MRTFLLGFSSFIFCVGSLAPSATAASLELVTPTAAVSLDPPYRAPDPTFRGTKLIKVLNNESTSIQLESVDRAGVHAVFTSFTFPDTKRILILGCSSGLDGTIALGGESNSIDGSWALFFSILPPDGNAFRTVRTDPYAVRNIAVADDGSVWAVGNVLKRNFGVDPDPTHGVVRHFDSSGRLLGSYIPQENLDDPLRQMMGELRVSKDRVGWLSTGEPQKDGSRRGGYVEFGADGAMNEYPLPPIAAVQGLVIHGLALTDNGTTVASVNDSQRTQLYFQLDRAKKVWTTIALPGLDPPSGTELTGASGNTLAVWRPYTKAVQFYDAVGW